MRLRFMLIIVTGLLLSLPACDKEPPPRVASPRPVTVVPLTESDPSASLRIPGIVKSWAEEDVSFEVSGRIEFIVEQGTQVEGRWVESGAVLIEGDVLARVDRSQYEAAARAAEADVKRAMIELEQVAPAKVAQAKAIRDQRQIENDRIQQLHEQQGSSELEVLTAQAALEVAIAEFDAARASMASAEASLARNLAALETAQLYLDHSELHAPFRGEVADIHTIAGGYARAGSPVLHLVMMDPIKIDISVSGQTNRNIANDDPVLVYVPDHPEPIVGKVYQRSTSADPRTRTFTVTVIMRNAQTSRSIDGEVRIGGIGAAMLEHPNEAGPIFVDELRALHNDGDKWFVWTVTEILNAQETAGRQSKEARSFTLHRVPVVPGDRRINLQGLYVIRELADSGELTSGQLLALDVPDAASDGDVAQIAAAAWTVRPGDLVDVELPNPTIPPGFYVPMRAVLPTSTNRGAIFVVADDNIAHRIEVDLGAVINELQHIQSPKLSSLPAGTMVVLDGARFLQEGESVERTGEGQ